MRQSWHGGHSHYLPGSGWRCNAQSALGKWRQPPSNSGQSIVRREANSRIPRNPRIQELRFGSRLRAPARVNQTDSHTDMKAGGCRLKDRTWPGFHSPHQPSCFLLFPRMAPPLPAKWPAPANRMGSNESGYCRVGPSLLWECKD